MTLETGVEALDPKLMERAQASTPRLRAAFAQVLMTYAAGLRGGAARTSTIWAFELQKAADQVLGRPAPRSCSARRW
jgi:hypothetical protein